MGSGNLYGCLSFWARRWPNRVAICCPDSVVTWGELEVASNRIGANLYGRGISRGGAVGILMGNRAEFAEVMFGTFRAGAALVLLNVRYTAREMVHPVLDSGLRLIVTEEKFLPQLKEVRETVADLEVYVVDAPEGERHLKDLKSANVSPPDVAVSADDIALICYTSGTTGVPKGAILSHGNIFSAAAAKAFAMGQNFNDRALMPLPLAFTGGAVGLLRDGVIPGSTIYLIPASDPGAFLELIEREKITSVACVPVFYEQMLAHRNFGNTDFSSLRYVVAGGGVPSLHLLKSWQKRGVALVQGYGLTEAAGSYCTILFDEDAERKLGCAGRVLPNVDMKLLTEDGRTARTGEVGEILIRGPIVTRGYFNSPQLNAEAFIDGWLRTGDVGTFDDEGYLKIVDRSKDMLISGGLNVYPAELEKALAGINGLNEFAIIGLPDERWGEIPVLVSPDLGNIDLHAFRKKCEEEIADYKRPKYLIPHEGALPRTLSGKVQKAELRSQYRALPPGAIQLKTLSKGV